MSSAHLQTLGAFVFRGKRRPYRAEKHAVRLFDNDQLVIHDDKPKNWITGDRIAIIIHGLCGCHLSPYVVRSAGKLNHQGIRTIRVDMRGFGDSALISKTHLHGGLYQDAQSVIEYVHRLSPLSKLSLIGFSIGGNVILKTLGMWGGYAPEYVDSAIAISPPVDLIHASWNLRQRGNRIYEKYFMKRIHTQLSKRRKLVSDLVDNQISPLPNRMIHWDDQFTAPCWGYSGVREYYADASSCNQLVNVSVPTIILAAQDDPVVPFSMFSEYELSNYIDLVTTKKGGHLGYIGTRGRDPDRYWMDWRICNWITSMDDRFANKLPESRPKRFRNQSSSRRDSARV